MLKKALLILIWISGSQAESEYAATGVLRCSITRLNVRTGLLVKFGKDKDESDPELLQYRVMKMNWI